MGWKGISARHGTDLPQDWAFLALACHQLGLSDEAQNWQRKLDDWKPDPSPKAFWNNVEVEVLRDEVRSTLASRRK